MKTGLLREWDSQRTPTGIWEIISYVISGALEHKDSLGSGSVIHAGHVQKITAGSGIAHSEFNHSDKNEVHFLQIWIVPRQSGLTPEYTELDSNRLEAVRGLKRIVSPDGRDGSLMIHQDAHILLGELTAAETVSYPLAQGRGVWIQMVDGELNVNGYDMREGDGLSLESLDRVLISSTSPSRFLLFDLA
jgi:redox-sensitive bicupin YhaK (pirin superfamily)